MSAGSRKSAKWKPAGAERVLDGAAIMRIGIDASRATMTQRTGTERYSLEVVRALLEMDSRHRWRLYFRDLPPPVLWDWTASAEVRVIPFPRLWTHIRLSWEMATRPPDILYVPAHVLPIIHPRRSVVTIHDLGYRCFPEAHPPASRLYLELGTRWNARRALRVVVDSQATRADLERIYGTPAHKIRVIYPGHTPLIRRVEDPARIRSARERLGIPERYILYIGTIQPRKNLVRLIEAYAHMRRRWPADSEPPHLVLGGKMGWMTQDILGAVQRWGLQNLVHLVGYVPDEELPALLSGALAFAFPSLYEGFGFPVLEAMACGTPVICSNTSSLPEVAGGAAVLVNPLDTAEIAGGLLKLLQDEELRRQMVEAGYHQVQRFSWASTARQLLELFEEIGTEPA